MHRLAAKVFGWQASGKRIRRQAEKNQDRMRAHKARKTEYLRQAITPTQHQYTVSQGKTRAIAAEGKIKLREKDAPPAEIKRKIVFSDLRNPPNNFTPLFGEVAKYRTLTEKDEQ